MASRTKGRLIALAVAAVLLAGMLCLLYHNHSPLNDWLTAILTYVIAAATALALFQDWFRSLFWYPELQMSIAAEPPDSHRTYRYASVPTTPEITFLDPCYYYRLKVRNIGNAAAREVEVYATQVKQWTDSGWSDFTQFIPQYLSWSLLRGTTSLPIIPPKASRYCDLGHVLNPVERANVDVYENDSKLPHNETILSLDVSVKALRRGHLLPKGKYKIHLEVTASNAEPRTCIVTAINPGVWHDDEATMLRDGVRCILGSE